MNLLKKFDNNLSSTSNEQKNYFNRHINSIFLIVLLVIIITIITYMRVLIQIDIGLVSDSVDFFSNALVFAGQGFGYSDLIRPPLFSFIASIFVRMGYMSINTIFAVDGLLFIFGVIGMFMLLKISFSDLESFLGGLLYATFPIVISVLGIGFSDLSSVSFSIWTFYFLILAIKKDSKFFYLAFPFAMFAFLTRFNSALLIFPIFLYILINKDKIHIKNLIIGVSIALLTLIPVLIFYYEKFGNLIYPFITFGTTSSMSPVSAASVSYNPNIFFFIQNFPTFVGAQGITIFLILGLGALYLFFKFLKKNKTDKNFNKILILINENKIKWIFLVITVIVFIVSFDKTFYMLSEVLFFLISYLLYDLSKNLKNMDIHILYLSWFMVFFIFHSVFIIKDYRYFVLMAPAVAYFMILGLSKISSRVEFNIKNINVIFPVIAIILTSIILFSTASQLPLIEEANTNIKADNGDMELASQWFINNIPDYKNKKIYADLWPNLSWYLKIDVKPVPGFKDNKVYYGGIKDNNFTLQDSNTYNDYLLKNDAEYYLSFHNGLNLTSYKPIKQFGYLIIYKKI